MSGPPFETKDHVFDSILHVEHMDTSFSYGAQALMMMMMHPSFVLFLYDVGPTTGNMTNGRTDGRGLGIPWLCWHRVELHIRDLMQISGRFPFFHSSIHFPPAQ